MALLLTLLTNGANTTSSSQAVSSTFAAPTAGSLLQVSYGAGIASTAALTPNGVTATNHGTWSSGYSLTQAATWAAAIAQYYINGAGAQSTTLTMKISAASNPTRWHWEVYEVTGHDSTTPFGTSGASTGSGVTLSITLGASPSSASMIIGSILNAWSVTPTITHDASPSGWVEVAQDDNNPFSLETQDINTNSDNDVSWSAIGTNTNVNSLAIAWEVLASAGAATAAAVYAKLFGLLGVGRV